MVEEVPGKGKRIVTDEGQTTNQAHLEEQKDNNNENKGTKNNKRRNMSKKKIQGTCNEDRDPKKSLKRKSKV